MKDGSENQHLALVNTKHLNHERKVSEDPSLVDSYAYLVIEKTYLGQDHMTLPKESARDRFTRSQKSKSQCIDERKPSLVQVIMTQKFRKVPTDQNSSNSNHMNLSPIKSQVLDSTIQS